MMGGKKKSAFHFVHYFVPSRKREKGKKERKRMSSHRNNDNNNNIFSAQDIAKCINIDGSNYDRIASRVSGFDSAAERSKLFVELMDQDIHDLDLDFVLGYLEAKALIEMGVFLLPPPQEWPEDQATEMEEEEAPLSNASKVSDEGNYNNQNYQNPSGSSDPQSSSSFRSNRRNQISNNHGGNVSMINGCASTRPFVPQEEIELLHRHSNNSNTSADHTSRRARSGSVSSSSRDGRVLHNSKGKHHHHLLRRRSSSSSSSSPAAATGLFLNGLRSSAPSSNIPTIITAATKWKPPSKDVAQHFNSSPKSNHQQDNNQWSSLLGLLQNQSVSQLRRIGFSSSLPKKVWAADGEVTVPVNPETVISIIMSASHQQRNQQKSAFMSKFHDTRRSKAANRVMNMLMQGAFAGNGGGGSGGKNQRKKQGDDGSKGKLMKKTRNRKGRIESSMSDSTRKNEEVNTNSNVKDDEEDEEIAEEEEEEEDEMEKVILDVKDRRASYLERLNREKQLVLLRPRFLVDEEEENEDSNQQQQKENTHVNTGKFRRASITATSLGGIDNNNNNDEYKVIPIHLRVHGFSADPTPFYIAALGQQAKEKLAAKTLLNLDDLSTSPFAPNRTASSTTTTASSSSPTTSLAQLLLLHGDVSDRRTLVTLSALQKRSQVAQRRYRLAEGTAMAIHAPLDADSGVVVDWHKASGLTSAVQQFQQHLLQGKVPASFFGGGGGGGANQNHESASSTTTAGVITKPSFSESGGGGGSSAFFSMSAGANLMSMADAVETSSLTYDSTNHHSTQSTTITTTKLTPVNLLKKFILKRSKSGKGFGSFNLTSSSSNQHPHQNSNSNNNSAKNELDATTFMKPATATVVSEDAEIWLALKGVVFRVPWKNNQAASQSATAPGNKKDENEFDSSLYEQDDDDDKDLDKTNTPHRKNNNNNNDSKRNSGDNPNWGNQQQHSSTTKKRQDRAAEGRRFYYRTVLCPLMSGFDITSTFLTAPGRQLDEELLLEWASERLMMTSSSKFGNGGSTTSSSSAAAGSQQHHSEYLQILRDILQTLKRKRRLAEKRCYIDEFGNVVRMAVVDGGNNNSDFSMVKSYSAEAAVANNGASSGAVRVDTMFDLGRIVDEDDDDMLMNDEDGINGGNDRDDEEDENVEESLIVELEKLDSEFEEKRREEEQRARRQREKERNMMNGDENDYDNNDQAEDPSSSSNSNAKSKSNKNTSRSAFTKPVRLHINRVFQLFLHDMDVMGELVECEQPCNPWWF